MTDGNMTIGERAAQAIRERANQNGTEIRQECRKIAATRAVMKNWEEFGFNPNAYYLQQLALAGYDIYWILTGERKDNG